MTIARRDGRPVVDVYPVVLNGSCRERLRYHRPPLTLGFGRHRGQPLADVPGGYLRWVSDRPWLAPSLRRAIVEELARRRRADHRGSTR